MSSPLKYRVLGVALLSIGTLAFALAVLSYFTDLSPMKAGIVYNVETPTGRHALRYLPYDLGVVEPGEVARYEIPIVNPSAESWSLDRVRSTCGCIFQEVEPSIIGPGTTATLTLEFHAPNKVGSIAREVLLTFREPNVPAIRLNVHGTIRRWCESQPDSINFGNLTSGVRASRSIQVVFYNPSLADFSAATSSLPWVTLDRYNASASRLVTQVNGTDALVTTALVTAAPPPDGPRRRFSGSVRLPCKDRTKRDIEIPFEGTIAPPVSVRPDQLFFGYVHPGEPSTVRLELVVSDQLADVRSFEVRYSGFPDELSVSLAETDTERPWTLALEAVFRASPQSGLRSGNLELLFPRGLRVVIPVSAFVTDVP